MGMSLQAPISGLGLGGGDACHISTLPIVGGTCHSSACHGKYRTDGQLLVSSERGALACCNANASKSRFEASNRTFPAQTLLGSPKEIVADGLHCALDQSDRTLGCDSDGPQLGCKTSKPNEMHVSRSKCAPMAHAVRTPKIISRRLP
jgi:hypothetical protein